MKNLVAVCLLALAGLLHFSAPAQAQAQGQPCQWDYKLVNNQAVATYCGIVVGTQGINITSVANIAALEAISNAIAGESFLVQGTQGGLFTWTVGTPTLGACPGGTDHGTQFCSTGVTTGYWQRQYSGAEIPLNWFDSVFPNSPTHQDSAEGFGYAIAFQAARTSGGNPSQGACIVPAGSTYYVGSEIELDAVGSCIRGTGTLSTTIVPLTANQSVFRLSQDYTVLANLRISDDLSVGGITCVNVAPVDETQTVTRTDTDYVIEENITCYDGANGFRWRTGPNVGGYDSTSYFGQYRDLWCINCTYAAFDFVPSVNGGAGTNDNSFYNLHQEDIGRAANIGIDIQDGAGSGNRFYGVSFNGVTGTGRIPTATGIFVGAGAGQTDGNAFFGVRMETVSSTLNNNSTDLQLWGLLTNSANYTLSTLPAILQCIQPSFCPSINTDSIFQGVSFTGACGTDVTCFTGSNGLATTSGPIQNGSGKTVAGLPPCNAAADGTVYVVTDANGPTYNSIIVGGGAVQTMAFCDGTNWRAH